MQEKTMTHDFAAALLRDVNISFFQTAQADTPSGQLRNEAWVRHADVLAALSRALDPALTERAGEMVPKLTTWEGESETLDAAADLITAFIAQIAALRAKVRESALQELASLGQAQEAYEAQKAAEAERDNLSDKLELERALTDGAHRRAEAAEAKVKKLRAERDDALAFLDNAVSKAPEPLKALGKYLAGRLDEDEWPTAEQYLNAAAKACADRADAAEAERDALEKHIEDTAKDTHKLLVAAEAKMEKLRGALQSMPSVVRHTTVCQGPSWPDDRPGVWIAALTACENAVQEAVDAALTTEADNG